MVHRFLKETADDEVRLGPLRAKLYVDGVYLGETDDQAILAELVSRMDKRI